MPSDAPHGKIRTGDVSGTFIVGDDNHVTITTHRTEQQPPPEAQAQAQQHNAAQDQAAVYAVENGIMNVTYHPATEHEHEPAPDSAEEP
jgi:hypothetical protein